jgi:hypothetical protein
MHVKNLSRGILSFSTTIRQNDVRHFVHAPLWRAALNHLTEKHTSLTISSLLGISQEHALKVSL